MCLTGSGIFTTWNQLIAKFYGSIGLVFFVRETLELPEWRFLPFLHLILDYFYICMSLSIIYLLFYVLLH